MFVVALAQEVFVGGYLHTAACPRQNWKRKEQQ
jgi:hypothetical protein